jgi:Fur family iron response transcriptional regulator
MNPNDPHNSEHRKKIVQLLRRHGISPTVQRVKIASTMLLRPQHLSAEQVLTLTNQTGRPVSKATVYNSLGLFASKGLIRELFVDQERAFYDSSTHPHHHFYNPLTQEICDIDPESVSVNLNAQPPADTEISGIEVVVHLRPKQ